VPVPMTSGYAATSGEANSGTSTRETMSDRNNQQKETEKFAKRKLRKVARKLESAQGTATLHQLAGEIEEAGAELAYVKTRIEEDIEE
jgi:hypothetical protein